MSIKDLREKRARLWTQASEIMDGDSRSLSAEDIARYDRLVAEIDSLKVEIDRAEAHEARSAEFNVVDRNGNVIGGNAEVRGAGDERYEQAYNAYVRRGLKGMTDEQRSLLEDVETRANITGGTGAQGTYIMPTKLEDKIVRQMKWYGGMFNVGATEIKTSDGNTLLIPTLDDTSNVGEIILDNDSDTVSTQDVSFGQKSLGAFVYSSKLVPISRSLLQDAAVDIEDLLGALFAERLGRIENLHLTKGDGSNKPRGVVTDATSVTASTPDGSAAKFGWRGMLDLVHAVDPAYRAKGTFMFNDNTLKKLRLETTGISSTDVQPIWQPGVREGEPDRVLGYKYVINNDMDDVAASKFPVVFGDFSYYWIRRVLGITSLRSDEMYLAKLQIAFLAYMRISGLLTNTSAVKKLTFSS